MTKINHLEQPRPKRKAGGISRNSPAADWLRTPGHVGKSDSSSSGGDGWVLVLKNEAAPALFLPPTRALHHHHHGHPRFTPVSPKEFFLVAIKGGDLPNSSRHP